MRDSKVCIVLVDYRVHTSSVAAQYRKAAKSLTIDLNEKEHLREANRQIQLHSPKNWSYVITCFHILIYYNGRCIAGL